jgi:hypothetical protein
MMLYQRTDDPAARLVDAVFAAALQGVEGTPVLHVKAVIHATQLPSFLDFACQLRMWCL